MNQLKTALVLFSMLITFISCDKTNHQKKDLLTVQDVSTYKLKQQSEQAYEEILGTVRAGLKASIETKINGRIERLYVAPGSLVNAGQVLVELDVKEVRARLDQALALKEQANRDFRRYSALVGTQAIPQQEFDAAQARLRVAEASVAEAQTMLGYSQINAPFDGIVTKKIANVGDLAVPGKALLELEDPSALEIHVDVPEGLIQYLSLWQNLRVKAQTLQIDGKIKELAPAADSNSRTFLVNLQIPHSPGLRSGQLVRVLIPVGIRNVLIVPQQALIKKGQMELVYVADGNVAKLRIVKSGRVISNQIEILSGLQENENVIVKNAEKLVDLQPIKIN